MNIKIGPSSLAGIETENLRLLLLMHLTFDPWRLIKVFLLHQRVRTFGEKPELPAEQHNTSSELVH